jgi:CRP/FNR family transcriptional regulator
VAEYLQRVDIFRDLSREEIEALFHGVMLRDCSTGTVFFTPEDSSERLFILKEGQVELYRLTVDGKRLVTRRIGPGTIFGEMGLLGQTLHGCFAEATENSLVCVATRDHILRVLHHAKKAPVPGGVFANPARFGVGEIVALFAEARLATDLF